MAHDEQQIEIIQRQPDGWGLETFGLGEIVRFEAIDFEVPLVELYAEVVQRG